MLELVSLSRHRKTAPFDKAKLGLKPEETWNGQLKWAYIPKFVTRDGRRVPVMSMLMKYFTLRVVSEEEYLRTEA